MKIFKGQGTADLGKPWRFEEDGLTVTGYPNGTAQPGSLYVPEKLAEKDKYSFFLGGNQPLCVIENPDIQDGSKILLIGNVIEQEFMQGSNWNLGSGLSVVLMIFVIASMAVMNIFDKDQGGTAVW